MISKTNLLAGTSSGSFIALGLAYNKLPDKLAKLYSLKNSKYIFNPSYLNLTRPRYDNEHLTNLLSKLFPYCLQLKDLNYQVLVPSFDLIGDKTWQPVFFNNFPNSKTRNKSVIQVALASSAAPTYFPSYKNHIDGAIIANNPSLAALATVKEKTNQQLDDIYLLSIGTGVIPYQIKQDTEQWGISQWAINPTPPPSLPLLNSIMEGGIRVDNQILSQLLGSNYFRLNLELSRSISLDDYKQIPYLTSLAESLDLSSVIKWLKKYWF